MTQDDFDAWRENPVTQYVAKAYAALAKRIMEQTKNKAWAGPLAPGELEDSRARYDAYMSWSEMSFEDVQMVNGDSTEDANEAE